VLLHQQVYEDHTWVQLTDFAHKPSPNFDPAEELEALEVGQLNFVGRYLLVQLQYIKCFKTFTEEEYRRYTSPGNYKVIIGILFLIDVLAAIYLIFAR
jgi:hypothetical protein